LDAPPSSRRYCGVFFLLWDFGYFGRFGVTTTGAARRDAFETRIAARQCSNRFRSRFSVRDLGTAAARPTARDYMRLVFERPVPIQALSR
jgi:hypothetical protein